MRAGLIALLLLAAMIAANPGRAQGTQPSTDAAACSGSQPEPAQTAAWGVAFCNRTGHDLIVQFKDNDCPLQNWAHRGDVYQKVIRKGETATVFLCYATEPPRGQELPAGIPKLRLPGGRGVVTTWAVIGDCGDRSDQSRVDSKSFYDRGEFRSGIVLLQYPQSAPHCFGDAAGTPSNTGPAVGAAAAGAGAVAAAPAAGAAVAAPASAPAAASASAPVTASAPGSASTAAAPPVSAAPPAAASAGGMNAAAAAAYAAGCAPDSSASGNGPGLCAAIDAQDAIRRKVYVIANPGPGTSQYHCRITVALTFSDGGTWNDRFKADIAASAAPVLVSTRKYLKTVDKAELSHSKCQ